MAHRQLSATEFQHLAEFRRQIRQFLHFSESAAKEKAIEPQQHQLMLAVAGLPEGARPNIRELASRLFIHHNSAVELVNRLEAAGLAKRVTSPEDRREVQVRLTAAGETALHQLALEHRSELERTGPELARSLNAVLRNVSEGKRNNA
jgi:DNA-binding MarR family transcriptional regulator